MPEFLSQRQPSLLRVYLLPYAFLLILYLVIIGGGSFWLYMVARHAQTELITTHIMDITKPIIDQLDTRQLGGDSNSIKLSDKVSHLFQVLPHLRQISVRNYHKGYGVRLTSTKQLVDVELEPLAKDSVLKSDNQNLTHRLHKEENPFFSIYFNVTSKNLEPELIELAFNRSGLVGQIGTLLESLINTILLCSILGIVSLLFALVISIYTGREALKLGAHLQTLYHQASMGALSAALVHDLRNPLASIRANIKNLLITPEATGEVIDEMDQDLLRIDSKLSGFLKLTRPPEDLLEYVDIQAFVTDLVKTCKPLFNEKNQYFDVSVINDIPPVALRRGYLRDALLNLLINAREHTPEQGHVWLNVQRRLNHLEIIVEDDGTGFDKDILPHVFEPFFTTRNEGHGLGLAIVKRTIENLDGHIKAENRSPKGARFIITLPLKSSEPE